MIGFDFPLFWRISFLDIPAKNCTASIRRDMLNKTFLLLSDLFSPIKKVFMANPWLDFDKKWNVPPIEQGLKPVFALASIWRSGSTLLQRLLCSDPEIILWGEPYGDAGILPGLANSARCLLRSDWPHPMMILDEKISTMQNNT